MSKVETHPSKFPTRHPIYSFRSPRSSCHYTEGKFPERKDHVSRALTLRWGEAGAQ